MNIYENNLDIISVRMSSDVSQVGDTYLSSVYPVETIGRCSLKDNK